MEFCINNAESLGITLKTLKLCIDPAKKQLEKQLIDFFNGSKNFNLIYEEAN